MAHRGTMSSGDLCTRQFIQSANSWAKRQLGSTLAVLAVALSPSAQALLASITATQIGQPLAILIDGELRMAPIIREPISDGRLALTGFDSLAEANALVDDWSR